MTAASLSSETDDPRSDSPVGVVGSYPAEAPAIDIDGVSRIFRSKTALANVSLRVERAEIHALLGPNGAGKTTLLRIVAGLTAPSSGELHVHGRDATSSPKALRSLVGVVPSGSRSFYQRLSGLENLVFFARLHGFRRRRAELEARSLLDRVGLAADARTRVGEYSQGMQKRLAIARALLPKPPVLLVDEATHDLDPPGAEAIRSLVEELRADGSAVVWATQRVEEIQGFANAVTVLQAGRVRFSGSVPELLAQGRADAYLVELRFANGKLPGVEQLQHVLSGTASVVDATGTGTYLLAPAQTSGLGGALGLLLAAGIDVLSCQHERPGVERAFLALTGAA